MAAWQFVLVLVPKTWLSVSGNRVDALFSEEGWDTNEAWRAHQPQIDFEALFSSLLPAAESWSAEIKIWGDLEHTDVQVSYANGLVESIQIRIDVRENPVPLRTKVFEIANTLDCVLVVLQEKAVIEPNIFALSAAILRSRAARYVQDPKGYLRVITYDGI
jgi:hypothetical protein